MSPHDIYNKGAKDRVPRPDRHKKDPSSNRRISQRPSVNSNFDELLEVASNNMSAEGRTRDHNPHNDERG